MKELIFATGNASKGKRFSKGLLENNIQVLTLKDLDLKLDVEENGTTAIENARIKARECFRLTHKPSMGMDDTLYLEGVDEDKQPGLFVRRVNGKTLNDEEMIEHYINLVKQYGKDGRLDCKWIYGMVVINEDGEEFEYTWSKDNIYMVDTVSNIINPGYPLNSFTKYKVLDKYLSEITDEDKELIKVDESDVVNFIVKSLSKDKILKKVDIQ
jgi:inosine/xanthosine triphosphate pyrophosphatase family protein